MPENIKMPEILTSAKDALGVAFGGLKRVVKSAAFSTADIGLGIYEHQLTEDIPKHKEDVIKLQGSIAVNQVTSHFNDLTAGGIASLPKEKEWVKSRHTSDLRPLTRSEKKIQRKTEAAAQRKIKFGRKVKELHDIYGRVDPNHEAPEVIDSRLLLSDKHIGNEETRANIDQYLRRKGLMKKDDKRIRDSLVADGLPASADPWEINEKFDEVVGRLGRMGEPAPIFKLGTREHRDLIKTERLSRGEKIAIRRAEIKVKYNDGIIERNDRYLKEIQNRKGRGVGSIRRKQANLNLKVRRKEAMIDRVGDLRHNLRSRR